MKKLALSLLAAAAFVPSTANAQLTINMSQITCGQYLAMPPDQAALFQAWMSGWFNQKKGFIYVDLNAYGANIASIKSWCASYPNQTVMSGLQRATGAQ